jgi:WD40 repeat protein
MFQKRALLFILGVFLLSCASQQRIGGTAVVQLAHSSAVNCIAFSHDGRLALTGGSDSASKLWEVATGREIRTITEHSSPVNAVCFSPDDRFAASGSADGRVTVWEIATGRKVSTYKGKLNRIDSLAFSPDGRAVVCLSNQNDSMIIWDVFKGGGTRIYTKAIKKLGIWTWIGPVAISSDGRFALSAAGEEDIRLWEVSTGRTIQTFKGAKGSDSTFKFQAKHGNPVRGAFFSPDGRFVLILKGAFFYYGSELWDIPTGKRVHAFKGLNYPIVAISPNFHFALTATGGSFSSEEASKLTLSAISGEGKTLTARVSRVFEKSSHLIRSIAFSPDSHFALTGYVNGTLALWEVPTGRKIRSLKGNSVQILSVAYSPDGRFVLCGSGDNSLKLWNTSTGQNIRTFRGHSGNVTSVDFSPDGRHAVSGSDDKTVRLWNATTGHEIRTFRGHSDGVTSVAFSPDGRFVLSGGKDETLKLWDVATGDEIRTFEGHSHWVTSVIFSPDGRHVFSGAKDDVLKLWDVTSGADIQTFEGHSGDVNAAAISPDGRYVLAGGWRSIDLWDATNGRKIRTFKGHSGNVTCLAFSPDGHYALTGGDDSTLVLWRVSRGRKLKVLNGHLDELTSVAFSPDGRFVMSGSKDMTTRIWDIDTGVEVAKFMSSSGGEWIIVTPDGYYNTSPEGASLLHWVYPGGLETFTFEQFESRFKRPDIIKARLSGNLEAGIPAPAMTRPPHIEMADHLAIKETSARNYSLRLTASALEEVKAVRVFVNGKPTLEIPVNTKEKELSLDVPLFSGANRITAVAYDEKGFSSNPKYVDVIGKHTGLAKPNLYVFAIGISDYPRLVSRWQLEFAHTDAKALVEAFKNQEGKLFGEVRFNLLSNKEATVETITEVMDALSAIGENDLAVIFMAGHGVRAKDGTFYFLTSTGSFDEPQDGGVSWTLLGNYLERIKGRVILVLDACHSGSIVTETVVPNDELAEQFFSGGHGGVMVLSASKGRQYSLESPDIGGGFGIFTYALTQGLGPKSKEVDTSGDGFVEFMELVDYVRVYVDRVTEGEQTPWLSRKELFGDLPLAVAN